MKTVQRILSFALLCLLMSCQNSSPSQIDEALENENLSGKFAPFLAGNWVEASYMDSVRISKSPLQSQNALAEFVELIIGPIAANADSLDFEAVNIHEGSYLSVYFKKGLRDNSLPISLKDDKRKFHYELGYKLEGNDTSLVMYIYNLKDSAIKEIKYNKVTESKEAPFQYLLNKALFSGSYELTDSAGTVRRAEFSNDGEVSGLSTFDSYFVMADFVASSDDIVDHVCFQIQNKSETCYPFKFSGDTLRLFEPITDVNGESVGFGALKYRLVKKKN